MAQLVKNPLPMQDTWVRSLGWENLLEKGKDTYSSILAWRIPDCIVHGVANSWTQQRLSHTYFTKKASRTNEFSRIARYKTKTSIFYTPAMNNWTMK